MAIYCKYRTYSIPEEDVNKKLSYIKTFENAIDLQYEAYVPAVANGAWSSGVNAIRNSATPINSQKFIPMSDVEIGDTFPAGSQAISNFFRVRLYTTEDSYSQVALVSVDKSGSNIVGTLLNGLSPGGTIPNISSGNNQFYVFVNSDAVSRNGITTGVNYIGVSPVKFTHLYRVTLNTGSWYVVADSTGVEDFISDGYGVQQEDVEYVMNGLLVTHCNLEGASFYYDYTIDDSKKITNFYLADFSGEAPVERPQPIELERLQSTELRFCAVYEDGEFEEWTGGVNYTAQLGEGAYSIEGNEITILEDARVPKIILTAVPVYDNVEDDAFASISIDVINPVDPYTPPSGGGGGTGSGGGAGVPSNPGGGGGTFPSGPGPSMVESIPTGQTGNDLANSGLFTMYLMNQSYMNLIGDIMWEDNLGIQALKAVFGQPIDAIISTMSYPFDLTNFVTKTAQNLFFGPWNSGLPFQALTKSSFQIDWGTITIPFGWGNFLDYAPHTKMELFLPWGPGYVPIDPNDVSPYSNTPGNFNVSTFTNGSIQVKTNIELGKGTCVHNVIGNNGKVIGSYSGVVGKQVPMTALDTGGKALTTIAAVSAAVGGVVAGSLAAKGAMDTGRLTGTPMKDPMRPFESASYWDTGMISGRSSAQSLINTGHNMASRAINSAPITFPRAGTFSDGSSAMTVQQPFLLISRPVQSVPTQYGHYNGYPSNIHYANLSGLFGYTEISEIHLDNVTATADELAELDGVLKGGILL